MNEINNYSFLQPVVKDYLKSHWLPLVVFLTIPFFVIFTTGRVNKVFLVGLIFGYFWLLGMGIKDDLEREIRFKDS